MQTPPPTDEQMLDNLLTSYPAPDAEELAERAAWDQTLMDGLDTEPAGRQRMVELGAHLAGQAL